MTASAERDLLLGLLALQTGLIDQAALVAAFHAWTRDKARPLADHLVALRHLKPEHRPLLEGLAAAHLTRHGGEVGSSLAAIPVDRSTREGLAGVGDADVETSLAHLSRASTQTGDDFDRTTDYAVGTATSEGQRFRVLRPHARGGLGAVFVALDAELHREVALKRILDHHADDPVSRQRFLLEAEVTGGLEHPGIVPVYGLGTYGDGRPYYAMRFVRGDSLKEAIARFHADDGLKTDPGRRSLELRKLLRRFLDVCNAVGYAHSRGVLHRDIKPGNVIVGRHGETLVVDWGLAKVTGRAEPGTGEGTLAPNSASGSAETLPGSAMGTPAFMSPEQARGDFDRLGPRSDVYSLGATLHCLLTGKPPLAGDVGDVLRRAQVGDVPPPRDLDPSIDRALEAVCLKAMDPEPERRYDSCKALAEDVERWLADEPVSARREPFSERARRWARRHRTLIAGAAALMLTATLALAVGLVIVGRQQRLTARERDAKELARRNVRATLDAVASEAIETLLAQQPRLTDRHKAFLKRALSSYEEFAREPGADRAARAEVADAHSRMARIRGQLGLTAEAERALDVAIALYDRLDRERPDDPDLALRLAACRIEAGTLLSQSRRDAPSRDQFERAIGLLRRQRAARPGRPEVRSELARALNGLSNVLADTRDDEPALAALREALDLLDGLAAESPEEPLYRTRLASGRYNLGILLSDLGRPAEAEAQYRRAAELQDQLVRERPDEPDVRLRLSSSLINRATLIAEDPARRPEAEPLLDRGRSLQEQLVREYPAVPLYRLRLGRTYRSIAELLEEAGRPADAEAKHRRALEVREGLMRDFPDEPEYRRDLGSGRYQLGLLLAKMGRMDEAGAEFLLALGVQEPLVREMADVPDFAIEMTRTLGMIGYCTQKRGNLGEAEKFYRRCVALQEEMAGRYPSERQVRAELGLTRTFLGDVQVSRGAFAEALPWYEKAIQDLRTMLDERPGDGVARSYLADANFGRARALAALGRADPSMDALRRAIAAGFRDLDRMRAEAELAPLRDRPDFRLLLMDMALPADPFARGE